MRHRLGRKLATLRKARGDTQRAFAARIGCSRTHVSSAELGRPNISRRFFEHCDTVLATSGDRNLAVDTTGGLLAAESGLIRAQVFAEAREAAGLADAPAPAAPPDGELAGVIVVTRANLNTAVAALRDMFADET
jgi:transcriptional regulator with XRE-family HTH domain